MKSKSFQFFKTIFYLFLFSSSLLLSAQESQGVYSAPDDILVQKKLEQWQDLKFGLMMHWGAYSQTGVVESWSICSEDWCYQGEDYIGYKMKYEKLMNTFNPVKFDPANWARAAKNAGMRYLVLSTKHHDGFCMFDTKTTDYKITSANCPFSSNPRADVTKETFNAFREEGFMVGAYFSKPDWHSEYYWWPRFATPDRNVNYDIAKYPERWQKFIDYTHTQIDELMTNYGKLDILWLDGGWVMPLQPEGLIFSKTIDSLFRTRGYTQLRIPQNQDIKLDQSVVKARQKQPGLIVVDRFVEGKNQNYFTPEGYVPSTFLTYPWETCMPMGTSWAYNFNEKFKPARQLIHMLVEIVSKGGNLLLNVGPGPDGTWPSEVYERLIEIGNWMKINSESIYNTKGMKNFAENNFRFAQGKDGRLFATYLAAEGELKIPAELLITSIEPHKNTTIHLLGYKQALRWTKIGNGIVIYVPKEMQEKPPSKYAWVFSISQKK
jgi:alpha-L-fucosidase